MISVKIRSRALYCSAVVVLALQSACSTQPVLDAASPQSWRETKQQRQQINAWSIQGKLGVQTESEGGSVDLLWQQQDDAFKIRLIAPLGQGTTLVEGTHQAVRISTAQGVQYANDVESLLASEFGVAVPVKGLQDWLRGLPIEGKAVNDQRWGEDGHLYHLEQDGWSVEIKAYRPVGQHILPHKFYIGRADQPDLDIRLVIRQWSLSQQ